MKIGLVFPHQLFEEHELFRSCDCLLLIEEPLFFSQYPFHKKKIILHRASMKALLEEQSRISSNWKYISHDRASSLQIENELTSFSNLKKNIFPVFLSEVDFESFRGVVVS